MCPAGSVVYTVQPGDNLASIAERFYADGDKWQVLYQANQGRRMQDGATFDRAGVIHPGWRLIVPGPTETLQIDGDGQRWYTVRQGDTLAGISARLLGDEQRWPELFELNEGARADKVHVLRDPRIIWPGLALRIPSTGPRACGGSTGFRSDPIHGGCNIRVRSSGSAPCSSFCVGRRCAIKQPVGSGWRLLCIAI